VIFVHDDAAFADLVSIVSDARSVPKSFVEKDYWVTHTLWAIHEQGFDVWFKGGTSLSKGFDLIKRFSEDVDVKIEPGHTSLAKMSRESWDKKPDTRRRYFEQLADILKVPGADVELEPEPPADWKAVGLRVRYPRSHSDTLLRPFVLIEAGNARVTPFVSRKLSSFVHDHLVSVSQINSFTDNRPTVVRCVHPLVTLLEKLEAMSKRFARNEDASGFVRHYEDAACIIERTGSLPALSEYNTAKDLARDVLRTLPRRDDPAFNPRPDSVWSALRKANDEIGGMFWGDRGTLDDACDRIREWINAELT
jgi:hypothetical protein